MSHFLKAAMALALSLGLLACGDRDTTRPEGETGASEITGRRDANAPRASDEEDGPFAFMRYAVDTDKARPTLCLTFSEALDPATDYSAYLDIRANVALSVEGSRLCIGGLSYGSTMDVTLRAGLPAANGEKLATDESISLTFDDRPPVVAFSGNGVILPRVDADGLAIQTVNVDEVRIVVRRITDRALAFRQITEGYQVQEGRYYYEYGDDTPEGVGVEIWRGRMKTDGETNANVTTVFPLIEAIGELEPGAYYVEVDDAGALDRDEDRPARARRWILVTDLAFTAYRGDNGLDVTVRSLQTAEPVRNTDVQLIAQSNEILATAKTDNNGKVRFDAPLMNGQEGNRPRLLMAYGKEGDFAVLDLDRSPVDLSVHPVSGRMKPDTADAFIYLDRGIYRPGEAVYATVQMRNDEGRAISDRAGAMVLYQPSGLEQTRIRFDRLRAAGSDARVFDIPKAAARGTWRLAVELDGAGTVGDVYFSVEDFVPQRVELTLDADTETPIRAGETRIINASARFLYGAPGAGLPIDGTARIQVDPSPYKDWSGYQFGLHDEQFSEVMINLPEVAADGEGKAALPLAVGQRAATSTKPLRVRTVVRVQEPGGRAVADDIRIPYRPRKHYLGLSKSEEGRAERQKPVTYNVIALDALAETVSKDLDWRLVRKDYDYDWYRTDYGDWQWRRSERTVPIEDGKLSLDGSAPGSITTPPLDWGDYRLILTDGGEDVASAAFWVGWGGWSSDGVEAPDEVRVSGPETSPAIGETATIMIQPPYAGKAEVVIATDKVISTRNIDVPEGGTEISVPVSEDWGAGAYVMVTVYTPRDAVSQPRPRRAVGVAYVPVNVDDRTFEISFEMPDRVEPNQRIEIPVTATGGPAGEAIFLTLAAVDEGILLLTKHQSPDPVDWFFGKSRLGVSLYDDYGRLLDPNQGAAAPARSGGDQIGGAGLSVVPTKSVALFSGVVELDANGQGTIDLPMPDFNGELRLMAVAWSETGTGAASQPLTVRDDVPAELILPRFLAPGDEALASATVDNIDGPEGGYALTLTTQGPVTTSAEVVPLNLNQGQRIDENLPITAGGEGIAQVTLNVAGPDEFNVRSSYPIQVRSAFWPVTTVEKRTIAPGATYKPAADAFASLTPGSGSLDVSFAASPIDIRALFTSLYRYPYACTEQLVSRMTPLLYADQLSQLAGEEGPEGASADVREAIETILSRQASNGSIGLWRMGDRQASPWLGAYAVDFLSRAKAQGYPIPDAAMERALQSIQPIANGQFYYSTGYDVESPNPQWSQDTRERKQMRSSAYALYVLARNGLGDRSRLRYMHDEQLQRIESPLARAHIGAGLAAMGDRGRATSALNAAVKALGYQNNGDWYQTPRRDLAGILALAAEAGLDDFVTGLAARAARDIPEPNRLSTQEKAFLIMAARALAGDADTVQVSYDGQTDNPAAVRFDEGNLVTAGTFTNMGDQPIWLTALTRGTPAEAPAPTREGVWIEKSITDTSGRPVNLDQVKQGDRLVVGIEMQSEFTRLSPFIIADLLPAGFEIETILGPEDGTTNGPYAFLGELSYANVSEARDDRFIVAIDARDDRARFGYIVRAVTPGTFAMPGAVVEDMYRPDVFGRSAYGKVTIQP